MLKLLRISLTLLLILGNIYPAFSETEVKELPECVVITHCVKENWESSDIENTFNKVIEALESTPRTKIVEQTESYIHAEAKTKWRGYTDDLLIKALPEKGIIQVRSESRVGVGDNGVNKKRVDELAYRLMTNQIKSKQKFF